MIREQYSNYVLTNSKDYLVFSLILSSSWLGSILFVIGFVYDFFDESSADVGLILLEIGLIFPLIANNMLLTAHLIIMEDLNKVAKVIALSVVFTPIIVFIVYIKKKPIIETDRINEALTLWRISGFSFFGGMIIVLLLNFASLGIPPGILILSILLPISTNFFFVFIAHKYPDLLLIDKSNLLTAMRLYSKLPSINSQVLKNASKEIVEYLNHVSPLMTGSIDFEIEAESI